MINTDSLTNTINTMIKEQVEANNRKLYQFEKNKLYDHLGDYLVKKFKEYKCYVAGGTITSLFTNTKFNDIDLYFRDEKSCIEFVKDCWDDQDWVNMLTKKSILVKMGGEKEVQLIHFNFFNSAQEIFNTFDFTVCMGAFDFATEQFVLHDDFLKHNAQRILKFNKSTAFPIVSLLRVQKYNKKFYSISKPEFLRIAMRCMDLEIQTVEDLKDHLGGMYGINYDKVIHFEQGEEFTLDKVIDKIENLSLDEDYFKKPEEVKFDDLSDVIDAIKKKKSSITVIHDKVYRIKYNNTIKSISAKPVYYDETSGKEFVEGNKFYKFVRKESDNTYFSHYDKTFKYVIGDVSTAKNGSLYFNEKPEIEKSNYSNQGVLIECEIKYEDFQRKDGDKILAMSCKVIREVPKSEWGNWEADDEESNNNPFAIAR